MLAIVALLESSVATLTFPGLLSREDTHGGSGPLLWRAKEIQS
jgi:hypothetical protein